LPEPFTAERLSQLRQRWERDPKSRAFLQLAEEYRRGGRLADAVHVLEVGLQEHPTYLAAQVALGRCLLENGSPGPAIDLLERAVARDPTQLVANKLLVEAYLVTRRAAQARERLELYKLFNDRDTAIEPLEARIRALEGAPAAPLAPPKGGVGRGTRAGVLFDLPPVAALPLVRFAPAAAAQEGPGVGALSEPFGRLHAPGAAGRIDSAFSEAGIFVLPAAAPPRAAAEGAVPQVLAAPVAVGDRAAGAAIPAVSPRAAGETDGLVGTDGASAGPLEWAASSWAAEPAATPEARQDEAPPRPAEELAAPVSATLGDLYLAQGHFEEAEESFRSVLRHRPADAAALAGLESVRLQRGDEAEAFAEEPAVAEAPNVIVGGLTARKAALLRDYLARLRRGGKRRVS